MWSLEVLTLRQSEFTKVQSARGGAGWPVGSLVCSVPTFEVRIFISSLLTVWFHQPNKVRVLLISQTGQNGLCSFIIRYVSS